MLDCCWVGCCCVVVPPCWDVALPSLREREASWLLPRPAREPATPAPGAPEDCRTMARILLCADCEPENRSKKFDIYLYRRFCTNIVKRNVVHLMGNRYMSIITWTEKKGPIIWTVASSSAEGDVDCCSDSFMILPVTRCNSLTFCPPLPMIRPTWVLGTRISIVNRTSSVPATNPSSRIFSNIKYWAWKWTNNVT